MFILRPGLGATSSDLAQAIARYEGFYRPGSVAVRDNNPGNLRAGPGSIGTDSQGFAIFPDAQTGWDALQHQVDLNVSRGLSLSEFFGGKAGVYAGYAPSGDANDPGRYSSTVAGWLGIDANTPLSAAFGTPILDLTVSSDNSMDWSTVSEGPSVPVSGGGLSTGAMVGLGLAGLVILWAAAS